MRLRLKVSELMNERSRKAGSIEDRLIRIPNDLRKDCGLELGEFVNMRSAKGDIVSLRVSMAYAEDVDNDSLGAYATRNVFEALELSEIKIETEKEISAYEGLTLGCDPELFLAWKDSGKILCAKRVFRRKLGEVGHDGYMLEIRPVPSTNELTLGRNIESCLRRARSLIDKSKNVDGSKIDMIASSSYRGIAAGFHLHFGFPKELRGGRYEGRRWNIRNQIARALDYYVGITSIIPEGRKDNKRRTAQGIRYGKPGEYRQEGATFEYRVPGGYMLRHPILSIGLIGLGAIVMEDVLSRIRVCTNNFQDLGVIRDTKDLRDIYPDVPDIFDLYKIICSSSDMPARQYLDRILNDLTQMVGFKNRMTAVEQMFRCIYSRTEFSSSVDENWRLVNYEKQQG